METRVAVMGIIVEDTNAVNLLNEILLFFLSVYYKFSLLLLFSVDALCRQYAG